jgi:hypothetical protein
MRYTLFMRRTLHLLIILLLAVAVPLRAATVATMVLCGPAHERLAQNLQHDGPSGAHGHHADAGTLHAHSHAHDAVADASEQPGGDAISAIKHAQFKCALCGACCAGGFAIPSASLVLPDPQVVSLAFPPLVFAFAGWHPDGLERPPHISLV